VRSVPALAALLAVLAAPAHAVDQVVNYENVAVAVRSGVPSPAQVREAIMAAGKARQWEFTEDGPGRLSAVLRVRDRHEIHVLIPYDQRFYSVLYESSVNMNYRPQDGTIHSNYNRWVRDFVTAINTSLSRISGGAAVAMASPASPPPVPGYTDVPMPQVGDSWTYRLTEPDRRDGPNQRSYVVTVGAANRNEILDQVVIGGGRSIATRHTRGLRVFAQAGGIFSPYLMVFEKRSPGSGLGTIGIADPACSGQYVCEVSGRVVGEETVTVAAGKFVASKVVIEQSWRPAFTSGASSSSGPGARVVTVWYSPEVRRAIKYSSRLSFGDPGPMEANFDLELASYRIAPGPVRVFAAPKPPQIGDNWTYRVTDPKNTQAQRNLFVQVASVTPALIVEHVSVQGGFTQPWRHARGGYLIPQGASVFSPYLPQFEKMLLGEPLGYIENSDPGCRGEFVCQAKGRVVGEETVEVAAGRFPAIKVVVEQTWRPAAGVRGDAKELERMNGARTLTIWYSNDLKRAVKYESRLISGERVPMEANFDLELTGYQVK